MEESYLSSLSFQQYSTTKMIQLSLLAFFEYSPLRCIDILLLINLIAKNMIIDAPRTKAPILVAWFAPKTDINITAMKIAIARVKYDRLKTFLIVILSFLKPREELAKPYLT